MSRPLLHLLSDEERATLHEQTLTVLEEVGVAFNTPMAMDVLEGTEAILDRERLTARLPRELVMRCLETAPRKLLLAARDPANDVWLGDGSVSFTSDGTATYVVDDETGERHEGSADYLRTIMRLFDALPDCDYVWPTISARDLDPRTANLEIEAISFRSCAKHVQDEVRGPEYVAPLIEMIDRRRRRAAGRAADLLDDQLHRRAARPRRRHDGSEHRPGARRRADRHHADAADGHDGADHGGRGHRRSAGRAALGGRALPARGARLPAHRLAGAGVRRPAQRALRVRVARGRSRLAGLHRDVQAGLRPAHAGRRPGRRRQGSGLPGRRRGRRHPRPAGGRRLARRPGLLRRRAGHEPGDDRPAQRRRRHGEAGDAGGAVRRRQLPRRRHPRRWARVVTTWAGAARGSTRATSGSRASCAAARTRRRAAGR